MHFVEKKNFKKNKNEIENPTHSFRETNLAQLIESQIKSETVMGLEPTKERKKEFFVPFILSERSFLKICVLSQCTVY